MIESQTVRVGETRKIVISVKSTCRKAFEITNAQFKLLCGDEEDQSGECSVEMITPTEMWLSALITPQRANARYALRFTYTIEPETLIYECEIRTIIGGANCGV